MKTFVAWVLYISAASSQTYETSISLAVIDNIASERNCLALAAQLSEGTLADRTRMRCVAVRKVAP